MNVFRYEVWQYRRGLLGWCVGLTAFICLYMPFMPAFLDQAASLKDFFEGLGLPVLKAMNINADLFFGSLGFYGFLFNFLYLLAAIQAASLGLGIISKENRMKTADFLLTKPKSRGGVFWQKVLSAFVCLSVTQAVFYAVSAAAMAIATKGEVGGRAFVLITATLSFIQWLFLAIGILIATLMKKLKTTVAPAVGLALAAFLMTMVNNLTGQEVLRYFAPFRYFDNNYIMVYGHYEAKYLALCLGVTAALLAAAFLVYRKQDIDSV